MCVYVQYVYTVYTKPCKVYVINTNNKKPTQVAVKKHNTQNIQRSYKYKAKKPLQKLAPGANWDTVQIGLGWGPKGTY